MSLTKLLLLTLKSLLLSLTFTLRSTTRKDLKTKLYHKCDYLTFPIVNFPFISSNIPAYGVYILNSYVILEFVSSLMIFWTELRCWLKALLKQGYVEVIATKIIRSWSQSGWPLRNIHISNDNGSFTFYVDVFFLYHCQFFYLTLLYIWVTWRVSYKKHVCLTLPDTWFHPRFVGGPCCSFF